MNLEASKDKAVAYRIVEEGRYAGSKSTSQESSIGNIVYTALPALVQMENSSGLVPQSFPVFTLAWKTIGYTLDFRDERLRELYFAFRVVNTSPIFVLIVAV